MVIRARTSQRKVVLLQAISRNDDDGSCYGNSLKNLIWWCTNWGLAPSGALKHGRVCGGRVFGATMNVGEVNFVI